MRRNLDGCWFCFIPSALYDRPFFRNRVLPKRGSLWVYRISDTTIRPNPAETEETIHRITQSARDMIGLNKIQNPNFLGISLGNAPAYVLAEETSSTGRLVSVVPGSKLPECIGESIATREIMQEGLRRGYAPEQYQHHLSQYGPLSHVSGLQTQNEIYLAGHDLMIPFPRGLELAAGFKEKGKEVKVHISRFKDHFSLLTTWKFPS